MPGEIKTLQFAEGVAVDPPTLVYQTYYLEDDTTWDGAETTGIYDVSDQGILEAHKMTWALKDPTDSYRIVGGDVTHTSGTNVTFTFIEPLPAGTYILVGR